MTCLLVGGASTNSRGAMRPLPPGITGAITLYAESAVRERVRFLHPDGSTDERTLLSWVGGQWGGLWGNRPPPFLDCSNALTGAYGHQAEHQLADELGEIFDGHLTSNALGVRFFQSAGEACAAAARLARFSTGRWPLASYGYHGAGEEWAHEPASGGIPPQAIALNRRFEWGNVAGLAAAANGAAGVMVEVPALEDEAAPQFLRWCRVECDYRKIPFILDDTVLGFRIALAGSTEYYSVKPDVLILGKAMSARGGVAALVGRLDLLAPLGDGRVFYSTTFGGAPGPVSVAVETLRWLRQNAEWVYGDYGKSGYLRKIGVALRDGLAAVGVKLVGQPERSIAEFPSEAEWLAWCSRMAGQGVIVHRPFFPTLAHTQADVDETVAAARKAVE